MRRVSRFVLAYLAAALVLLGLGAGFLWLSRTDPDVAREIEDERADNYCRVTMNRIALALRERARYGGAYPASLGDLRFEEPFHDRCPRDPEPGPSYELAAGIEAPAPSSAILAWEIRPNHESRTREKRTVKVHRVLTGRFTFEAVSSGWLGQLLAEQGKAIRLAAEGSPEELSAAVRTPRSDLERAFAARGLAARSTGREALVEALATASHPWVRIELAAALALLGDRRGVTTALELLTRPEALNYFERERLVRLVEHAIPEADRRAPGRLEPLDTREGEVEKVRKILEWWRSRG